MDKKNRQDRQPVRSATQLEQKYKLNGTTAAQKYAAAAAQSAAAAQAAAENATSKLTQETLVALLGAGFAVNEGNVYIADGYITGTKFTEIRAQMTYTAMAAGTVVTAPTYEQMKAWYDDGYWNEHALTLAVNLGFLTEIQKNNITG